MMLSRFRPQYVPVEQNLKPNWLIFAEEHSEFFGKQPFSKEQFASCIQLPKPNEPKASYELALERPSFS